MAIRILFLVCALGALGFQSPPLALILGIVCALTFGNPFTSQTQKATKILLQASVVGLGFGMNLHKVLQAGLSGLGITFLTIALTLAAGILLSNWLGLKPRLGYLISAGTAICGGSAIAAVGPVVEADQNEMSVSLATIFILNSIGLILFPFLGHLFGLTQEQFGIWSAIAIHDTSSVVGAASRFGPVALEIATTIKLARALWIVPLVLFTSFYFSRFKQSGVTPQHDKKKTVVPYFIFYFLLASVAGTYIPVVNSVSTYLVIAAKSGLNLTLFFIGAGLSLKAIRAVGVRPLLHGVTLWVLVSVSSLTALLISKTAGL